MTAWTEATTTGIQYRRHRTPSRHRARSARECCVALLRDTHARVATVTSSIARRAALLTFGGAYAVLPYVYQGAVQRYGWLTPTQMIDGLALGETTPGPLIMVAAFVGFVGAWMHAPLGYASSFVSGAAGATVATFFTFPPSFQSSVHAGLLALPGTG